MNTVNKNSANSVDVAFIIVNYNTKNLLEDLLNFFAASELPFTYSLIVVDNGSSDGSLECFTNREGILVNRNSENIGYGKAVNRGIAASNSEYVCVLNTDLILNTEALIAVWQYLQNNPGVNVCSPVLCYPNGRIQGFFFKFNIFILYSHLIYKIYLKLKKISISLSRSPIKVDGVTGAFICFRRTIINDDKLFDEDYFFYYEDTDLAHRWQKEGIECVILPTHRIIHIGGQSGSGKNSKLFQRSKYMYIGKQFGINHVRRIYNIDYLRIRSKVFLYTLINAFYSTDRVKYKLSSYREMMRDTLKLSDIIGYGTRWISR